MSNEIILVPIGELIESPINPRTKETPAQLKDLMDSVREKGIIQPLTIRPLNGKAKAGKKYEIVAGHRRFWAAEALKETTVPCHVKDIPDFEVAEYQMIENIQREDIHPIKQAEFFESLIKQLMIIGGVEQSQCIFALAGKIGKPPSYIAQLLQLTKLTKNAKALYESDIITLNHALLITSSEK